MTWNRSLIAAFVRRVSAYSGRVEDVMLDGAAVRGRQGGEFQSGRQKREKQVFEGELKGWAFLGDASVECAEAVG